MNLLVRVSLVAVTAVLTACGQDQAFRLDERVSIISPRDRAVVRLPVTLRWRAEDVDNRSFAVFVDRAPVRPGKKVVASVGATDAVYTTTETSLVIRELYQGKRDGRERHRTTLVLVDGSGHRVGESAWDVVFDVERKAGS